MEPYARPERIAALEQGLPALSGLERLRALTELCWHLRERDTRRAAAMAADAVSVLASLQDGAEARALSARLGLVRAACATLAGDVVAAQREADAALDVFSRASDRRGCADAHLLRSRLAGMAGDSGAARAEAIAAQRAAASAEDPARSALAAIAIAMATDAEDLDAAAGSNVPAAECGAQYVRARMLLKRGALDAALESLAAVTVDAPLLGMDELALDAQLAMARAFAGLDDRETALEIGLHVSAECRARGWRGLLASAVASVSEWLLRSGDARRALELLGEARAALAPDHPQHAMLEALLGEAQLAAGRVREAADTLRLACEGARAQGDGDAAARARSLLARALAACGDWDEAGAQAVQALRAAREARSRSAEMEALATLGDVHALQPSPERTARSAIAFLRHAAEVAEELQQAQQRAAFLHEIARLHEVNGELAAALAAQRAAHAAAERAATRHARQAAICARLRCIRDRVALQRAHAEAVRAARARHEQDMRDAYGAVDRMRGIAQRIVEAPDAASIVESAEHALDGVADIHRVALFVFDAVGARLSRYARESGRAIPVRDVSSGELESYAARVARERRELHVELESARHTDGSVLRDSASLWFGPVESGSEILGVLTVQSRRPHAFGEREKVLFRALCGHAAVALAKVRLREALQAQRELRIELEERLRRLATVDPLTGLATRAQFMAVARERLERARRDGGPCGLIVADVDAFKGINDIHGHGAGDRVLAAVAATLAAQLQVDDVAGRIGGEEFAMLLPGASLEATVATAERMRLAVEAHPVMYDGRPVVVTLSFGCTAVADAGRDIPDKPVAATVERLVREADAGLYEAQGTGGNRVIAWPAYQALRALRTGEPLAPNPQSLA